MEENNIYLVMCLNDVIGNEYYTKEEEAAKKVEEILLVTGAYGDFWYKTLTKKD